MNAGYLNTQNKIQSTLVDREDGTQIQPKDHQEFALMLLDYIRSVELISASTLIGQCEPETVPVQPNDANVAYIGAAKQNQTTVFSNFIGEDGEPISITVDDKNVAFVVFTWNRQYWTATTTDIDVSYLETVLRGEIEDIDGRLKDAIQSIRDLEKEQEADRQQIDEQIERIDSDIEKEANARKTGDNFLNTLIQSETSQRQAEDRELADAINAERTARQQDTTNILEAISNIGENINVHLTEIEEKVDTLNEKSDVIDGKIDVIDGKIDVIDTRTTKTDKKVDMLLNMPEIRLTLSPSCVYKGSSSAVSITGAFTNFMPEKISLIKTSEPSAPLKTVQNTNSINYALSQTFNEDVEIGVRVVCNEVEFSKNATIFARHPIYYGFGNSATAVATTANRIAATTTANRIYPTKTATANGVHLFLLIPTDIPAPSLFTMGSIPFVMNASTITLNGISYRQYQSGATYNSGAEITLVVS